MLVVEKVARLVAPYKATESRVVVLAALTDMFLQYGFDVNQALVLSVKAYEIA